MVNLRDVLLRTISVIDNRSFFNTLSQREEGHYQDFERLFLGKDHFQK
jgi:hypothetical protein